VGKPEDRDTGPSRDALQALREAQRWLEASLRSAAAQEARRAPEGERELEAAVDVVLAGEAERKALLLVVAAIAALTEASSQPIGRGGASGPQDSGGRSPGEDVFRSDGANEGSKPATPVPLSTHATDDLPREILEQLGADALFAPLRGAGERRLLVTAAELAGIPRVAPASPVRPPIEATEHLAREASVAFVVRGSAPARAPAAQALDPAGEEPAAQLGHPDPPTPVEEAEVTIIERPKARRD
jgi:hypothetical protein